MGGWLSPTIVTTILTALGTILGSLQLAGHRSRRVIMRQAVDIDELETEIMAMRRDIRSHNDTLPSGVEPCQLRDLPECMRARDTDDQ